MQIVSTAKAALVATVLSAPAQGRAEGAITLPSGRDVTFHDVIWGEPSPAGLAVRFRFVDPDLAEATEDMEYRVLEADMAFLCDTYALERISNTGPQPSQIIVSISDRPVAFGEATRDVAQVFEAYRPENGTCIWEGF